MLKSIGEVITGSVINVPAIHCPPRSCPVNCADKSNAEGKLAVQKVMGFGLNGIPEDKVSSISIVIVEVRLGQAPLVGTL